MTTHSHIPILQQNAPDEVYLQPSTLIDFDHPNIQEFVAAHPRQDRTDEQLAQDLFEFVRDEIHHSWDIQSHRVTAKASEALEHRTGICYAKSHLLAALLRAYGILAGICYQRLTLGDTPDTGYCIHALNTVYLESVKRWIRLDARGNKPGINAQFSRDTEQLAFPIRTAYDEKDYLINFALPHPSIAATLASNTDCRVMYANGLPTELTEPDLEVPGFKV